jgi:hypothetical protein
MTNIIQEMSLPGVLQPDSIPSRLFPITSRYYKIDAATLTTATGQTVAYLRRRFVPPPERFELLQEHWVTEGDRLDNITAHYLGDPEQFWRIADANNAMNPMALTQPIGRKLRITLPDGLSGARL